MCLWERRSITVHLVCSTYQVLQCEFEVLTQAEDHGIDDTVEVVLLTGELDEDCRAPVALDVSVK